MRQAACVAGAWAAASALPVVVAGEVQHRHPRSLLVDSHGSPWPARQLKSGEAFLFNYPYTVSAGVRVRIRARGEAGRAGHRRQAALCGTGRRRPEQVDRRVLGDLCPQADVPDDGDQLHRPAQRRPRRAAARDPLLRRQLALRPVAGRAGDRRPGAAACWRPCCWSGTPAAISCTQWARGAARGSTRSSRSTRRSWRSRPAAACASRAAPPSSCSRPRAAANSRRSCRA